jgi:two-component system sensor histidine kinase BaeS
LSILRGEIEAVQDGIRPLDQKAVNALHGEVLHLGRLVDDLYELSMTDLGSLTYRKTLVDPVAILQGCLTTHTTEFQDKDIALTVDNQVDEQLAISADPDRLEQLFDNLLSNTLRYTDVGGYLRVTIGRTGNDLLLDFMDSTPGVPAEDLPHLFDRFFRGSAARDDVHDGAGLGLSICRNIVHAHGGTIGARAAELGGVWVRVTLPL